MQLYLTPASLSHLTLFIMALLITSYLVIRFGGWRAHHLAHLRLLTAFLTALTLFALLLLLESALPPGIRLFALYAQNTVLGVVVILLLQFTYHFPAAWPHRWEARLALALSVLYTLYEAGFAVYRYTLTLGEGHVVFRPEWADFPMALGLLWAPLMLARQAIRASRQDQVNDQRWALQHLWHPQGQAASAARALALIYLLPVVLAVLTILKAFYLVPPAIYQLSLSVGMLAALAAFTFVYLNFLPETTSFIVKLVGVLLVTLLAVLGTVGWVLTPTYAALYRPTWPADQQTFRFTPNAQGGYDIAATPFQFESDFGQELNLVDTIHYRDDQTIVKLDFAFPFYGQRYSEIYVTNDGSLALGRPIVNYDYQYHYGGQTPLIFPLLTDLNPGEGRGKVFARQEADRLIITFDRVPSFYHPADLFTFQLALQNDGVFEITYNGLPEPQAYHANDEPLANLWLIGSTPGDVNTTPQALDISQLDAGQTIVSGPQGVVQDYYLGLRRQLNDLLQPLARLMITVSVLAVAGFPWLLYRSLVRPLNRLLRGVQQVEAGDYTVNVPVQNRDEIGFLTRAFNSLTAQLNDLIQHLSAKVAERTAELSRAKTVAEEQRQLAEAVRAQAEAVNVQLEANLRELQARNEELDAFSHTVAHDIRSPVSQMVGVAEMLAELDAELSPEVRAQSLSMLMRGGEKLTNIIDELLLLAGLRHVDVPLEPLNMAAIVTEALARLQQVIEQAQAEVTLPDAGSWPVALGHPAWVEEVWVNYLSNACKYGGVDGQPPRIVLGSDPTGFDNPSGSTLVRFWVRDSGSGIAPDDQSRLFTPFTRLDQVRARGHGLGLSIVRRIVEKLGGEVDVKSDGVPGHGSEFSFTLPAAHLE
jgi:signal transduction histidine kinase